MKRNLIVKKRKIISNINLYDFLLQCNKNIMSGNSKCIIQVIEGNNYNFEGCNKNCQECLQSYLNEDKIE